MADITSGLTLSGSTVDSGVVLNVLAGATATDTTVNSGGTIALASGGLVDGITKVLSGGLLSGGGIVSGDLAVSGTASEIVISGANTHAGTWLSDSQIIGATVEGTAYLGAGTGMLVNTIVGSAGSAHVLNGGAATNTVVSSGGALALDSGGTVNSATVSAGGVLNAASGGSLIGTLIDNGTVSGGTVGYTGDLRVNSGGVLSGTATSNGTITVNASGTATNISALSGSLSPSTIAVNSGGIVNSVTVSGPSDGIAVASNAGVLTLNGGTANNTTVYGYANLVSGQVNGLTVQSHGAVDVEEGATVAAGTTVTDGGLLVVNTGVVSGAKVSGAAAIISGQGATDAEVIVRSGGTLSATSFGSGGYANIDGGTLSDASSVVLSEHLETTALTGWDMLENSACRWTNGDALLSVGEAHCSGLRLLSLQILASGSYPVEQDMSVSDRQTLNG